MANPLFRRELSQWIRFGQSSSHDGIPAYGQETKPTPRIPVDEVVC